MSYQDIGMRNTTGNSYGTVPEDVYLRKIKVTLPTSYEDDNDNVEDYYRRTLKDMRPDTPFFESDQQRGDVHSKERLNLRYGGARTTELPNLPDGTFLDWEFMERDPRGIATGPDMRKHYEQQMQRASLIKFYNDDDLSVPEQGISPETMVKNIKDQFYNTKSRYRVFDESFDGWHNGGVDKRQRTGGNDISKIRNDGVIVDLANSEQRNRADAVTQLSNDPTMAYRLSETDHRFKIARYGMIRAHQNWSDQDWDNNKRSTFIDHKTVEMNGQLMNRMLANMIVDLQGQRSTKMVSTQGATYGDSEVNMNGKKKLHPDDVYKALMIGMVTGSQAACANEAFEGAIMSRKHSMKHNNRELSREVQINHEILASMQQTNTKVMERNTEDIRAMRDAVAFSANHDGVVVEGMNRHNLYKRKDLLNRDALDTRTIEDSKEIRTYGGIQPSKYNNPQNRMEWERFGKDSKMTKQRHGRREGRALVTKGDYEQEQETEEFGVYDKATNMDVDSTRGRNIYNMDSGDIQLDGGFDQLGSSDLKGLFGSII
jgi:hypothetical protein